MRIDSIRSNEYARGVAGRRLRGLLASLVLLTTTACQTATTPAPQTAEAAQPAETLAALAETNAPAGQLPTDISPTHYELALTIVPAEEKFSGVSKIKVALTEARSVVWLHGRDMEVSSATVTPLEGELAGEAIAATWSPNAEADVVALRLERPVPAGAALIEIAYSRPFDRALKGLYRVDTEGESYAFTQFEALEARQAFPCFDEPRFKVPFDVSLTVKKEHAALANTKATEEVAVDGGMKRIHYATTEALPTYLVAWAVGPLDVVEGPTISKNSVRGHDLPFRGVAVKGQGGRLGYALERTAEQVKYLEEYFNIAYPYDKLDVVAVPDFAAGAMENAGLITFRDNLLLIDEAHSPESMKRAFAGVMAHELAHQWFGNLVTMPWWDDIWLNEAFASWMGDKVVAHLYPEYKIDISELRRVHYVMGRDSMVSARQIRQPIVSNHDVSNAFDGITYVKGGAVLAMFERWLGEETFRDGMRHYMTKHAFGNATADDLIAALEASSGKDVAKPFQSFLMQPGVPFLKGEVSCGAEDAPAQLSFSQSRFLPVGSQGARDATWTLPVCVRYGSDDASQTTCAVLDGQTASMTLEGNSCPEWVMPNADGAGYYRFALDGESMDKLRKNGFKQLTVREKLVLADSLSAAFSSGDASVETVFSALQMFAADENRAVASVPMSLISFAREYLVGDDLRAKVDQYGRRLYAKAFKRLGFKARPNDDGETKLFRASVVEFMALTVRDPKARAQALRLAKQYVTKDGLKAGVVEPELADVILAVAAEEGDAQRFEQFVTYLKGSQDAVERRNLLSAVSRVSEPELAAKARDLALDPALRTNEAVSPLRAQFSQPETREASWSWFKENYDKLTERLSAGGAGGSPWIAAGFCSEEMAGELESFFEPRVDRIPGGPRNLSSVLEGVALCSAKVNAHREGAREFFKKS